MSTDTLALLLTFLFISLFGFGGLAALLIFISRDTTRTPELLTRISNIEQTLLDPRKLSDHDGNLTEIWRTADGKYEANSFEELLTKMTQDPDTPLSVDEIESIKSIFEKIMGERDDDSDTDWNRR